MRDLNNVEEKILDRALYLIGKTGSMNVPIRAIAKEADVNVSAVNYYFRTKDEMLRHIKQFFIDNSNATLQYFENETMDDETKLAYFANEIMEYNLRFPGVTVILKYAEQTIDTDEMSAKIVDVTKNLHDHLEMALRKVVKCDEKNFIFRKLFFLSSMVFPLENSEVFYSKDIDFYDEVTRKAYIHHLIQILKG
jgi:AcrR family transcriptional regulator